MDYSDEMWYVGSGGYKNNTCVLFITKLDLYKSLVVLWIVNTVNELIHLKSFTKTLSTYPSVLKLFQNLKSILYEL